MPPTALGYAHPVIKTIAAALRAARSLPGEQVEDILCKAGIQRGSSTSGRAPRLGQERYERRNGVTRVSANPDPLRKVAVFERRIDGYVA